MSKVSKNEKYALSLLIERGLEAQKKYPNILSEELVIDPYDAFPIICTAHPPYVVKNCYGITGIGYALMGLEGEIDSIATSCRESYFRARAAKNPPLIPEIAAASDMLGVSEEILLEVNKACNKGLSFEEIISWLQE